MKYDVLIIGGGASGLCAAILIKRKKPDYNVAIIEAQNRVGKKLLTTGNGRCNITNRYIAVSSYHGENVEFCEFALKKYGADFTEEFFDSLGIPLIDGENGKMYPYSLQASAVVDALRLTVEELGVETFFGEATEDISKVGNEYKISTKSNQYVAKKVIVAVGSVAGGKSLISYNMPYKLLTELGHSSTKINPSLVQLKTDLTKIKALTGIKLDCEVSAFKNGKKLRSEIGELLFTKYGISGPPVLQISRCFTTFDDAKVKINLMCDKNYAQVKELLVNRKSVLSNRNAEYFFTGIFPKMIGHTLLKIAGVSLQENISNISDKQISVLSDNIVGFEIEVCGNNGFDNAQVTAGGIRTEEFNCQTMESLKCKGIYAIGEILDIDGDCGGYNLQWAWSSAAAAAEGICNDTVK